MTYNEALSQLPIDAEWGASFGNPGDGGYNEIHRTKDGTRYILNNGNWTDFAPFTWTIEKLKPMPKP